MHGNGEEGEEKYNLYTWGWGENGRLGNGKIEKEVKPFLIQISDDNSWNPRDVVAGGMHTMVLMKDESVYIWGLFHFNLSLSLSHTHSLTHPSTRTLSLTHSLTFHTHAHTLSLTYLLTHSLSLSLGDNSFGQCGIQNHTSDTNILIPTKLNNLKKVKSIAAGIYLFC